jgi:hypothetical protein
MAYLCDFFNIKIKNMTKHLRLISGILFLFLFIHGPARAQPGVTWTIQATPVIAQSWSDITFGNGVFVAITDVTGSRVMTSSDGITWTPRTTPVDNNWGHVTFGNGLFVAIATSGTGNRVMTSPDGINWTLRATPVDNIWNDVTYANGLFVAVASTGTGDQVMTSADGIAWTIRSTPANNNWNGVTYGNGLFVAVASTGTNNRVMTSPDGITWTVRTTPNLAWISVAYGSGLYVAVSTGLTGNHVMTSPDGITWTSLAGVNNRWMDVVYDAGLFVAVARTGTGNRVMTSPDGITWTARTTPADNDWTAVTYGAGQFVAVATTGIGNQVMTSGSTPLPLHWLSVNATLNKTNQACMNWQVNEKEVMRYEVEKSIDGTSFRTIGSVAARGDGRHSYTFTESQGLQQMAYYRIKQIDLDGRSAYSSILILHSNPGRQQVGVYPNPAKDVVTVSISNDLLNKNATVTDLYGKTLQTIKLTSLPFTISIEQYPAGIYFIKVGEGKAIKIIKE